MGERSQSLNSMKTIDRRALVRAVLFGAAGAGLALTPVAIQAMPFDELTPHGEDALIEKAQAVVVGPRRRRRRVWRCWWNRGRRVCGWRWVW
jgi:hypothetical protein